MRVSCNFLKINNYSRELVCIYESERVVKTRGSRCFYSCFSFGDVEKIKIYWLGSSYAIDSFFQIQIDARSLIIVYITLKLIDHMGKALDFWYKRKKNHSLKK